MPAELTVVEWSVRLIVAALLSGLVGFERQTRQKAAGLRTHMLVGLGAALFTLVGAYGFETGDASRVSAQIVTGVGFLGAGAIFRQGVTVRGLTTAAGLWAVAAIGMTAGAGLVLGAIVTTAIALVILYGLGLVQKLIRDRRSDDGVRHMGILLGSLDELASIVGLVYALDEEAADLSVQRQGDTGFVLAVAVRNQQYDSVATGVAAFASVIEAIGIDPE